MPNRHLKPESMPAPFGYSQVVESSGTRIVHVAGQVPLNTENNLVGEGDFAAQVRQSFENVRLALEAVGMTFNDVVKMQFFLTDIANLPQVRGIRDEYINTERRTLASCQSECCIRKDSRRQRVPSRETSTGRRSSHLLHNRFGQLQNFTSAIQR